MKASILFITYRHERYVAEAIRSAMAQDHPDLELVMCDDGSPDRTVEILEGELAACPPHIALVRAHSGENRGFHENFNRGLAACTGEVVVIMSGDDMSSSSRVSRICGEFSANPDCMLVCSNWIRIDDAGHDLCTRAKVRKNEVFSYASRRDHIYAGAPVCGATGAYRTVLRDRFPPMRKGPHAEDNCFWVRALLVGSIHYISEPLVRWRAHQGNQFNRLQGGDNGHARNGHLRLLRAHQCMWRQWMRDLDHAHAANIISAVRREQLEPLVWTKREFYRLHRYSIMPAPWKLWLASAARLLRTPHSFRSVRKIFSRISRNHLPLRLLAGKRGRYWSDFFQGEA